MASSPAASDGDIEEILRRQTATPDSKVSFRHLYRFSTLEHRLILTLSTIAAIAAGAVLPCFPLLFGDMAGLFQSAALSEIPRDEFDHELTQKSLTLVYLGIGAYLATYISTVGFMAVGEQITREIRQQYLRAVLRQNIALLDSAGPGVLSSRIALDCQTIQEGISEKVGFTVTGLATLISAYVIGFVKYWKLTLVASSILVVILATSMAGTRFIIKNTRKAMMDCSVAAGLAEEVLGSVRTVKSLSAEGTFVARFDSQLRVAEHSGRRAQISIAMMVAVIMTMTFMSHSLNFWVGSVFIAQGHAHLTDVITVAFAILIGSHIFGGIAPHMRAFAGAVAAASKVYSIIDRVSPLDPSSKEGLKLGNMQGNIAFRKVKHVYPGRPEQVILDDFNLEIQAGKRTAIVGASGSGKSTIIELIERFYTPIAGTILCDGHDVSLLNLRWFRQRIALVGQEPVLFSGSIFENIAIGALDDEAVEEKGHNMLSSRLEDRVHTAAKQANAHGFIMKLPEGYSTQLGGGGSQLSGGQKQRIAIARALIRNPAILLLDEATSALDSESDRLVREALDSASIGRTTIVVSHRPSSVVGADKIVVLSDGRVIEEGSHRELQGLNGVYARLFEAQELVIPQSHQSYTAASATADIDLAEEKGSPASRVAEVAVNPAAPITAPEDQSVWSMVQLTASLNRPEKKLILLGLTFSILAGCGGPTLAFLVAKAISELSKPETEISSMRSGANFWCLIMFVVGLAHLVNLIIQGIAFAICSEKLILRARSRLFKSLLHKEISFFDRDQNKTGALTSLLAVEAKNLSGISGTTLGTILMSFTTLIASMTIALAIGWKIALVCIATIPVLLGCGFYRVWMIAKFTSRSHEAYKQSSAFASEAISSLRTIASLSSEDSFTRQYEQQLATQQRASLVSILKSSLPYAASQSFAFFCVALAFWYGGRRIADGEYSIFQFFVCFAEIIFGAQAAGLVFSFASDIGKAKKAAGTFNELLREDDNSPSSFRTLQTDSEAKVEVGTHSGKSQWQSKGQISLHDVEFTYPTRSTHLVLDGISFTVRPGENIALVGSSGCGKSTVFALLERFYDPLAGHIRADGQDIRGLDRGEYRQGLAYVSQEPVLYSGTIRENILLGVGDNKDISDEKIFQACKDANIHDFVTSLPNGLATAIGPRGVMLSGGQKQRIAIARALLRNPAILLLDEATSALDSSSAKLIQEALNLASTGRTTISVTHNLGAVRSADRIYVMEQGVIVEEGRHEELMEKRGRYYGLVKVEQLSTAL
ncbi:P-loop containing nucleoside triphosphate hydrolase protein [Aspergillus karnatakaensis]|uniref:ABC transporter ATP-binding protein n=1 Tax=Aspergillus karnatakaensis TaxID=1810916 RepID=UPI003CCE0FE7